MINILLVELLEGKAPLCRYSFNEGHKTISGETVRKNYIIPMLKYGYKIDIDLSHCFIYTKSFLSGLFLDLREEDGFSYEFLKSKISYHHKSHASYMVMIDRMLSEKN